MAIGIALCALLWFGVATIWMEGRWTVSLLEAGVFVLAAAALLRGRPPFVRRENWPFWLLVSIAGWGLVQLVLGWTIAPSETEWAVLYWLAAACFFQLGMLVENEELFLSCLLWFGTAMSALTLAQLYTSAGKILWLIPTRYHDVVFGTFLSYNNYAAFVELLFPIALWRSLHGLRGWWLHAGVAALMFGSVIASASRAGSVVVTSELAVVLLIATWRGIIGKKSGLRIGLILAGVVALTLVAGYQQLWQRFLAPDPYGTRREIHESAIAMVRARPLTGFGLGTWASAYPAYAVADFGLDVDNAHSEWGQWAAEGGCGVAALMAVLFGLALRRGLQTGWGLGVVALPLHGLVDYPLVRLGLGCWWFVMLGLLARRFRLPAPNPERQRVGVSV